MSKLNLGDKAPDFKLPDQSGKVHQLSDYLGQKIALYFYPKDMTPGCTFQACNLRDNFTLLKDNSIQILGISADNEAKHQKFIDKHNLPFPLLADVDKKMINDYGVWGPKQFMGKKFDGILRTTFVVDEKGYIADIIDKVKTKHHAEQILESIK